MKLLIFLLLAILAVKISAEPDPEPARIFGYQIADVEEEELDRSHKNSKILHTKPDASSGRLFFRKLFGQSTRPPIVPIIITGTNNDYITNIDTPTSTLINTPTTITTVSNPATINTDPAGSGLITTNTPSDPVNPTNPVNTVNPVNPANPTDPTNPTRRFQVYDSNEELKDTVVEAALNEQQDSSNDLVAGSAAGNRAPARLQLRLRGDKRDQVLSIDLPARYRSYFRNGQRVVFQGNRASRRPGNRRVIRRRRNRRRNNKSKKNKRRRFIAA